MKKLPDSDTSALRQQVLSLSPKIFGRVGTTPKAEINKFEHFGWVGVLRVVERNL